LTSLSIDIAAVGPLLLVSGILENSHGNQLEIKKRKKKKEIEDEVKGRRKVDPFNVEYHL
jgi:hypothetical protein